MTPQISTTLLKTQSDARLAQMVAGGQERAFEALVARYERPLRRYCERMLSGALAEDVVQQTFLTLWSQLRNGNEIRELRPWLHRVAHNAALNTIKRAGYQYEQLDETIGRDTMGRNDAPDAVLERSVAMRETITALQALPERQREALVRTAIDGESRTVVALDLGLSDGAVGQLLHRARSALRAATTAITPLPLVTWLAGRHGAGLPHMLSLGGTKAGAAGGAGGTSATGGAAAGLGTAGGAAGGFSTGATVGLTSIAMKGAALVTVGLVAAATPVVAKSAFSGSAPRAVDSAPATEAMTPLKLADAPLGSVTSAVFSEPVAAAAQRGPGEQSTAAPTDATSADATSADTTSTDTTGTDTATDASATDASAGTDTTASPDQSSTGDTSSTDTTATDPNATTDPTPTDPGTTTDPATTDPGTATDTTASPTATTSSVDPSSSPDTTPSAPDPAATPTP